MKKKFYTIYIVFLFILGFLFLVAWPDRWINIDIGSFHYHKLWKGPQLEDITFNKLENDLDIALAKDFKGVKKYKVKVVFEEEEVDKIDITKSLTGKLIKRFEKGKVNETEVYWESSDNDYYIYVEVSNNYDDFTDIETILLSEGNLSVWGEKGENVVSDEISLEEDEDPITSYLKQNYIDLNINANDIKSYNIEKEEDTYSLKLALKDEQGKTLSEQLFNFYESYLIAEFDGQILPIDAGELSKQMQYYDKIKGIKLAGIETREKGQMYGASIKYGPLDQKIEIDSSEIISPKYDRSVLDLIILIGIGFLIFVALVFFMLFRKKSYIPICGLILFCLFVIVSLNIIKMKLSMLSIFTFLLALSFFIKTLIKSIVKEFDTAIKKIYLNEKYLGNKEIIRNLNIINSLVLVLAFALEFLALWEVKNISRMFAICIVSIWIIYLYIMPFINKFIKVARNDFKKDRLQDNL